MLLMSIKRELNVSYLILLVWLYLKWGFACSFASLRNKWSNFDLGNEAQKLEGHYKTNDFGEVKKCDEKDLVEME